MSENDRKFQIEMFKIQLLKDVVTSILGTLIAVAVSVFAVSVEINSSNMSPIGFLLFAVVVGAVFAYWAIWRLSDQKLKLAKEEEKAKMESVGLSDTFEVVINKKRGNANFEIKHDGNGKETMTITSKDENGKEIKIEIPSEVIQELRKSPSQTERQKS